MPARSTLQGLGYTDEDSAGQQNIFAVEVCGTTCSRAVRSWHRPLSDRMTKASCCSLQPRQYVAGSSRDTSAGGVAPIILVAGAIGLCILGVGLIFNKDSAPSEFSFRPTRVT